MKLYNSKINETYHHIGNIDVDSGRIVVGDWCNPVLNITTVTGDGCYPVYATDLGRIIIDLIPHLDLEPGMEKEWAEIHHNCTQMEL